MVDPEMRTALLEHRRARRTRLAWVSAAAATTAVLVAAVGWIAIRPSDAANSQPLDESSPVQSESVSPTPESTDRPVGHVVQPCGGRDSLPCPDYRDHLVAPMKPGSFSIDWTAVGQAHLALDLPDSWHVLARETTSLQLGPASGGRTITFLYGPRTGGGYEHGDGDSTASNERDAEEIIDWLTSNPELASTEPIATTIDGHAAWDLEVVARDFVPMFAQKYGFEGTHWSVLDRAQAARIVVVDGINNVPLVLLIRDNHFYPSPREADTTQLIGTVTLEKGLYRLPLN